MKRFLLITLTLLLTVFLSSCGNAETNTNESNENSTEVSSDSQVEEIEESSDNIKITMIQNFFADKEGIELSDETIKFIDSNDKLFPTQNADESNALVDSSITSKHINKNASDYKTSIIQCSGNVISIEEEDVEGYGKVSYVHLMDDEMQSYEVLYLGPLSNIFEDDRVYITGLPVGTSGFENVSGGYTNTIALIGSYAEKIEQ